MILLSAITVVCEKHESDGCGRPNTMALAQTMSNSYFTEANFTIFIHVGKTGGSNIDLALGTSGIQNYFKIHIPYRRETAEECLTRLPCLARSASHQMQDPIRVAIAQSQGIQGAQFITWVRDPVQRFVSSFNWRMHIWKTSPEGPTRSYRHAKREKEFLLEDFTSVNDLGERLFIDPRAKEATETIVHLLEGPGFYFSGGEFIRKHFGSFIFVGVQEFMNEDIQRLGEIIGHRLTIRPEYKSTTTTNASLSKTATQNIQKLLKLDYDTIQAMVATGIVDFEKVRSYFPTEYCGKVKVTDVTTPVSRPQGDHFGESRAPVPGDKGPRYSWRRRGGRRQRGRLAQALKGPLKPDW